MMNGDSAFPFLLQMAQQDPNMAGALMGHFGVAPPPAVAQGGGVQGAGGWGATVTPAPAQGAQSGPQAGGGMDGLMKALGGVQAPTGPQEPAWSRGITAGPDTPAVSTQAQAQSPQMLLQALLSQQMSPSLGQILAGRKP